LLYIERWLIAPFETEEGQLIPRGKGVPQGGVVSPLLMNLFMHYTFDIWMVRNHPQCPFARYADDGVVHCHNQAEAERLMESIRSRLEECLLTIHPEKSKIVYCKDGNRYMDYPQIQFTFLGFTFRSRKAMNRYRQCFGSFSPAVSKDAMLDMREQIRSWNLNSQTFLSLEQLGAKYNPVLRGWWNYYGRFYKAEMRKLFDYLNQRLVSWAQHKFKKLWRHKTRASRWLQRVSKRQPDMFYHWKYCRSNDWVMGAV
jgi:group II intron reverse transcriptase/maturase